MESFLCDFMSFGKMMIILRLFIYFCRIYYLLILIILALEPGPHSSDWLEYSNKIKQQNNPE